MQVKTLSFQEKTVINSRNFCNKVWNAARYSLSIFQEHNLDSILKKRSITSFEKLSGKFSFSEIDIWFLDRLHQDLNYIESSLKNFQIAQSLSAAYMMVWDSFCSFYLENSKCVFYHQKNEEAKEACAYILAYSFHHILKALHPFIPFITEEIYQKWPLSKDFLINCNLDLEKDFHNTLKQQGKDISQNAYYIDLLQEMLFNLRSLKGKHQVPLNQKPYMKLATKDENLKKIFKSLEQNIKIFVNLESIEFQAEILPEDRKIKSVDKDEAFVPVSLVGSPLKAESSLDLEIVLYLKVSLKKELKRLEQEFLSVQKQSQILKSRLDNKNFVTHASPELVQEQTKQLKELQVQMSSLKKDQERILSFK